MVMIAVFIARPRVVGPGPSGPRDRDDERGDASSPHQGRYLAPRRQNVSVVGERPARPQPDRELPVRERAGPNRGPPAGGFEVHERPGTAGPPGSGERSARPPPRYPGGHRRRADAAGI